MIRSNRKSPTIFLVLVALMMAAVGFTHELRGAGASATVAKAATGR